MWLPILVLIILFSLGVFGIYMITNEVIETSKDKKLFITHINDSPIMKEKLRNSLKEALDTDENSIRSYTEFGKLIDEIREIIFNLPKRINKDAIREIYINNSEEGKINCLKELLL